MIIAISGDFQRGDNAWYQVLLNPIPMIFGKIIATNHQ
jgi:hypothetical protein